MITGKRSQRSVFIDGTPLLPDASQAVANHSPDGFNWGYEGSGPAQLALALLLFFTDRDHAVQHYQAFKAEVVAHLSDDFRLSKERVREWLGVRAVNYRPDFLDAYCDKHLIATRTEIDGLSFKTCDDCEAGAPIYMERCTDKNCGRGIPNGQGFYNFGEGAIFCQECGEKRPKVPAFFL